MPFSTCNQILYLLMEYRFNAPHWRKCLFFRHFDAINSVSQHLESAFDTSAMDFMMTNESNNIATNRIQLRPSSRTGNTKLFSIFLFSSKCPHNCVQNKQSSNCLRIMAIEPKQLAWIEWPSVCQAPIFRPDHSNALQFDPRRIQKFQIGFFQTAILSRTPEASKLSLTVVAQIQTPRDTHTPLARARTLDAYTYTHIA